LWLVILPSSNLFLRQLVMFIFMTRLDWFFFVTEVVCISISPFTANSYTLSGRLVYLLRWWFNMFDCIPFFCS
jgi:hypothetical protein